MHHTFLYISLPLLYDYKTKLSNFTFCGGHDLGQQLSFSFPEVQQSFRIQLHKNANIWQIEWDGMSAIKFDAVQVHFLSEVSVAIAVVVAEAPYY